MTTVLTSGTFDLLHYGHINLLMQARGLGDCLVVACSSDECVETKGKKCYFNFSIRKKMLESIRYVDEVVEENSSFDNALLGLMRIITKHHVSVFALGSDYRETLENMKGYEEFGKAVKIVFLERTPEISTTAIKKDLGEFRG